MPVTCCSYYYSFVTWFDIEKYDVCSFVSLSQDRFDYLGSFVVPYIFRTQLSTSEYMQGNKITISNRYLHCYVHAQSLSCVRVFATTRIVAHQALLSMGFPRQEHWNGLPIPSQGDLPNPGIQPVSPALQADSLPLSHQGRLIMEYILPKY